MLEAADQAPGGTTQILDLYKNALYAKQGAATRSTTARHTWPNSCGFRSMSRRTTPTPTATRTCSCDIAYNGARDNSHAPKLGGELDDVTTLAMRAGRWCDDLSRQTWLERHRAAADRCVADDGAPQGDVARALFYLDVRYEGGVHGA